MDFRVVWSPEAVEDVESIAEYIARDSEFYAKAVVSRLLEEARSLVGFPLRGRIVPELGDEAIRERFAYSYRLIYRIQRSIVTVVAVVHGARLLRPAVKGRLDPEV
ncbi:MAG: type II toxin-antitoxin system RelE/ParE family toxin [Deltaproteobacteria bacterium]|nr:type II toxin-antitoxin system RelE/ParE family toxin [Deltaproteobacteria bacterium]